MCPPEPTAFLGGQQRIYAVELVVLKNGCGTGGGEWAGVSATQSRVTRPGPMQSTSGLVGALADSLREFTVVPQWFWNDVLTADELVRQIDDFQAHGVYGFMIHPRVGLPRDIGWMSDRFLHFMHVAIEEARRRDLLVYLYDEKACIPPAQPAAKWSPPIRRCSRAAWTTGC